MLLLLLLLSCRRNGRRGAKAREREEWMAENGRCGKRGRVGPSGSSRWGPGLESLVGLFFPGMVMDVASTVHISLLVSFSCFS